MAKNNDIIGADEIRSVRTKKGMTQQQFADFLRVSPITITRWETGQRGCTGAYARQILSLRADLDSQFRRGAAAITSLRGEDLNRLDSVAAVDVIRDLLFCQSRWLRLPTTAVHITSEIKKDGGIDASIDADLVAGSDDLLLRGGTFFQIKTGQACKPWVASWIHKELFGNANAPATAASLGTRVLHCLNSGGRYVLVCFGATPTEQQIAVARRNLVDCFKKCGFTNTHVEVWGQDHLIGLLAPYPSLCLQIAHRSDLEFQDIKSWLSIASMSKDKELHLGPRQIQFIEDIRSDIRGDSVRHIRVTGEPGLGKTRLVLEALLEPDLAPIVAYVQSGETFQTSQLFNQIMRSDNAYRMILVVDDCPSIERASIWNNLKLRSDRIKLVTIYHQPESAEGESTKFCECPPLDAAQIEEIITDYIPTSFDAKRWADFCGGSPRVAHAVGLNLKNNPDDILRPPDNVPIWDRFVAGFGKRGSPQHDRTLTALRHIALFQKFGFEHPLEKEAQYIATLAQKADPSLTWQAFQEIVKDLKDRRILQGNRTLFIVPKALHVYLWIDFWNKCGRGFPIQEVLDTMPEDLRRWFTEMFLYAHASEQAKREIEKLLAPNGPFTNEFVKTEFGAGFLDVLAEAHPEATLSCIERTIGKWTPTQLQEFKSGRQRIVWALEKIAIWRGFFQRAANVLLRMASTENASNGNNSTGTFVGLFNLSIGPMARTETPPLERFPVLEAALKSDSERIRAVAIRACRNALSADGMPKFMGPEYQGIRPTAKLWKPDTWGEVYDAYRRGWALTVEAHQRLSGDERSSLAIILIESAHWHLHNPHLAPEILSTLDQLSRDPSTPLESLVTFITNQTRLAADNLSEPTLAHLKRLDMHITGHSFASRFRRLVMVSSWDEDYDMKLKQRTNTLDTQIAALAQEAIANPQLLRELIPDLTRTDGRRLFGFGYELGKLDAGLILFDDIAEAQRKATAKCSVQLFGGYLRAIFHNQPDIWNARILELLEDPVLRPVIGMLVWSSGATKAVVLKFVELISKGELTTKELQLCSFAPEMRALDEDTIQTVLRCALKDNDSGMRCALELADNYYCDEKSPKTLPAELTLQLLKAGPFAGHGRNDMASYHWKIIADRYRTAYPSKAGTILESALRKCSNWRFALDLSFDQSNQVLRDIINANPREMWDITAALLPDLNSPIANGIRQWFKDHSFGDSRGSGILRLFPMKAVLDWVAGDPEERAKFLARAVPPTLDSNEGGELTREFLIRFGELEHVGSEVMMSFWSGGFSGPASNHYRSKRDQARSWLASESSQFMKQWLERYIRSLNSDIERAEIEEERRF